MSSDQQHCQIIIIFIPQHLHQQWNTHLSQIHYEPKHIHGR